MPIDPISARQRIIKITDRRTGEIKFRSKGGTGIQWAACGKSIKYPFKPPKDGAPKPPKKVEESESNDLKRVYYISFNNTFFATVNTSLNRKTVDEIIAEGRRLFNVGMNIPIFILFKKPCKAGRTY